MVLVHSRIPLADPGLLASVRQQAKEVLMEKGVELVLGETLWRGFRPLITTSVCLKAVVNESFSLAPGRPEAVGPGGGGA